MNKELADRVLNSVESWAQFASDNPDDAAEAIYLLHAITTGQHVDWGQYYPAELGRALGAVLISDLVKKGHVVL